MRRGCSAAKSPDNPQITMKHHIPLLIAFATLFLIGTAISQDQTPGESIIRVLLVDDTSTGYYPMGTATTLRNIIRQDKQFSVVLVEDAEVLGTNLLFDYDVVLLHFKNYREPQRNAAMKANLEKFVSEGGGLFVYHFACGAFEDWADFDQLIGRVWDPQKPPHDPYGTFTVQIADKAHPITKDIADFDIDDELYTCLKDSTVPIHVIAEAVSKIDGKTHPMAFILEKGKGRIFHTTLGHDDKSLSSDGFQTMIKRALVWCAKESDHEIAAAEKRRQEIIDSLPEGAKLLAYHDCGGIGSWRPEGHEVRIVAPANAKRWTFKPKNASTEISGVPSQHFTVLYDDALLTFEIDGLDKTKKYLLNVVWWDFDANGRIQSLTVQSPDLSMTKILRPGTSLPNFEVSGQLPKTISVMLPMAFVRNGKLVLNVSGESGANVVVSEIWINEIP